LTSQTELVLVKMKNKYHKIVIIFFQEIGFLFVQKEEEERKKH